MTDKGITHMWGGDGDDTLDASANWYYRWRASLNGDKGDDRIKGGDGNDNLSGGWGNDWISGGGRADRLMGGHGDDTLDGGKQDRHTDTLSGSFGDDLLIARAAQL